ncbi:flagellar basal body P-ring formation chaperone FlgA [Palleronia sp. KMU-117]|uniref:flagellar basal body P-ring formation chaperone FlgA n=1 Tax=Palleronia sp. KMU-117 TaxID=3434108 RepID=UPI003D737216
MIDRVLLPMLALLAVAPAAAAETVLAARTIRAQALIGPEDITIVDAVVPGMLQAGDPIIGMEARVVLYAGRPIRPADIGPPAIVDRNGIVVLVYRQGGLSIETEGRALGRGGVGDRLRVMNLSSRTTVTGEVREDGTVLVGGAVAENP